MCLSVVSQAGAELVAPSWWRWVGAANGGLSRRAWLHQHCLRTVLFCVARPSRCVEPRHEPPDVRRWLGDSIGRWEGDTLVVDTKNFNDTPSLGGATKNLHVVERFKRIDDKSLLYQFTVEDPTMWTKPWGGEILWPATDQRIFEYACHEGNYSFTGILRGARLLEAEAEKKKAGK